jgi:hypothetical protein
MQIEKTAIERPCVLCGVHLFQLLLTISVLRTEFNLKKVPLFIDKFLC